MLTNVLNWFAVTARKRFVGNANLSLTMRTTALKLTKWRISVLSNSSLEDHEDVSGISLSGDNQGFPLQGRYQFTVKIFLQSKKAKVNIKNR